MWHDAATFFFSLALVAILGEVVVRMGGFLSGSQ